MRVWNKEYRNTPNSNDEKRINQKLREMAKNIGVEIIDSKNKGGGYTPSKKFVPDGKWEKTGVDPDTLKDNQPYIFVHPENKPHILAHELGHAKGTWYFKKKRGKLATLVEETRANHEARKILKKLKPEDKTMKDSIQGIKNCEKHYLEDYYQYILGKLKRD